MNTANLLYGPEHRRKLVSHRVFPWWPALLLVTGGTLRAVTWRGLAVSDPGTYTTLAHQLAQGQVIFGHAASARLGLYGPPALLFKCWGVSDFTVGLTPFLASLGTILLAYLLGKRFGNKWTGRWAGLLVATQPIEIAHATQLFPEAALGFLVALAAWLATSVKTGKHHSIWIAAATGTIVGLAYTVKLSALILVPILTVWFAIHPENRKHIAAFLAGLVAILALEALTFRVVTGDALFTLHAVSGMQQSMLQSSAVEQAYQNLWIYPRDIALDPRFAYMYIGWIAGLPLLLLQRHRIFPIVWAVVVFLFLEFASSSWRCFVPVPHITRYLGLLSVPVSIGFAQAWCGLPDRRNVPWKRILPSVIFSITTLAVLAIRFRSGLLPLMNGSFVACAILTVATTITTSLLFRNKTALLAIPLVFSVLFGITTSWTQFREYRRMDNIRHAFTFLKTHTQSPVYTDERTLGGLQMFWNYQPPIPLRPFPNAIPEDIGQGSYVVINWKALTFGYTTYGKRPPEGLRTSQWPTTWKEVARINADSRYNSLVIAFVEDTVENRISAGDKLTR